MTRTLSSIFQGSILLGLAASGVGGCGGATFTTGDGGATEVDSAASDSSEGSDGNLVSDARVGSNDAAPEAGPCPSGEALCAPCGGPGTCAAACPAIACISDAGASSEAGATCPIGEHFCSGCGVRFCGQVCPAIACLFDASIPVDSGGGCSPTCAPGLTCCSGGAVGSHTCFKLPSGATCPAVP